MEGGTQGWRREGREGGATEDWRNRMKEEKKE